MDDIAFIIDNPGEAMHFDQGRIKGYSTRPEVQPEEMRLQQRFVRRSDWRWTHTCSERWKNFYISAYYRLSNASRWYRRMLPKVLVSMEVSERYKLNSMHFYYTSIYRKTHVSQNQLDRFNQQLRQISKRLYFAPEKAANASSIYIQCMEVQKYQT